MLFGGYAFVDGAFAIAAALIGRTGGVPWWARLLEGVIGLAAGFATVAWPGLTALTLHYLITSWVIGTSVFEVVAAIRLRRGIEGERVLKLSGILSVLVGVG